MMKSELAALYAPELGGISALNRLNRWMNRNSQLMTELGETGYVKHSKVLTARQVEIIFRHLGEP